MLAQRRLLPPPCTPTEPFDGHGLHSRGMTGRGASVATVCVLLFAPAALVGCSSSHDAARNVSQGDSPSSSTPPKNRLIVLGDSIAGISLGEPRKRVERAFGQGISRRRGLVWYFGGRLLVDYWFHDRLTTRVEEVETRWRGFHTRSGVHIGTSRQELRALHVTCGERECSRAAGRMPDAPGTVFTMRHGKVAQIDIFYG
jgi:hypothetical protein